MIDYDTTCKNSPAINWRDARNRDRRPSDRFLAEVLGRELRFYGIAT